MATEKTNTFEQLAQEKANNPAPAATQPVQKELSVDDFSNTAIGDKVKYNRPDLNGKEDTIEKFQVFTPDINETPKESQSGASKYWQVTVLMTYGSKNTDDVQNREYISGAKAFQQRDGGMSEIQFWYSGSETQTAQLWELVAKTKKIEPEQLSPREFIAYLNNRPKVKIEKQMFKNFGAAAGAPAKIGKNMIGGFL